RHAEAFGEVLADRVHVPAGHHGRGDGSPGAELDAGRDADAHRPDRSLGVCPFLEQGVEELAQAAEDDVRASGDVERLLGRGDDLPVEIGDTGTDTRDAEVGNEEMPPVLDEAQAPRWPADAGLRRDVLLREPEFEEPLDALGYRRAPQTRPLLDLEAGRRLTVADEVQHGHQTREPVTRQIGRWCTSDHVTS